jgi:hypothetical protein
LYYDTYRNDVKNSDQNDASFYIPSIKYTLCFNSQQRKEYSSKHDNQQMRKLASSPEKVLQQQPMEQKLKSFDKIRKTNLTSKQTLVIPRKSFPFCKDKCLTHMRSCEVVSHHRDDLCPLSSQSSTNLITHEPHYIDSKLQGYVL